MSVRNDHTPERWRPIEGWEGFYEVSDHGRVRSLDRIDSIGRLRRGKILQYATRRSGDVRISMCRDARHSHCFVSHLVADAFMEPRPPGHLLAHLDRDITNNALANLAWRTPSWIAYHRTGGPERDDDGYIVPTRLVAMHIETSETLRFRSLGAAVRAGFSRSAISKCLRDHCNTHGGYTWAIDNQSSAHTACNFVQSQGV